MKLHQFLSKTGKFASKYASSNTIQNSQIEIRNNKNIKIINNPMHHLKPKDRIYWKGKELQILSEQIYILINKPKGYLCSKLSLSDINLKKKSIFDLIQKLKISDEMKKTLICVGRLDEDTAGLLIITNDGMLSSKLTDPKNEIKKTYIADLENEFSESELNEIRNGIVIDLEENGVITKYKTKKCEITKIKNKQIKIIVIEGKKREIKRMFEAVGNKVVNLKRISIGNLLLGDLKEGESKIVDKKMFEKIS